MKIRYFSDLHLEFMKFVNVERVVQKISPGLNEVAVLAGDVGNPRQPSYWRFMEFMNEHFKRTFVIAGNHEYYNSSISETDQLLRQEIRKFQNIRFLQNECETYEGRIFMGTTLWSTITDPRFSINDTQYISGFDHVECNRVNKENVEWLKSSLDSASGNCVVITHHLPSSKLIAPKYDTPRMRPYNQWFYCHVDDVFRANRHKINCWIYGHTHSPYSGILDGVRFLCNPVGYPGENGTEDFSAAILLD